MTNFKITISNWARRLSSLKRVPEIFHELWLVSRRLVLISLTLRLLLAAIPPLLLWVSKLLIDTVARLQRSGSGRWLPVWELFITEFGLIALIDILSRIAGHSDGQLSDRFSHRLNVRILRYSGELALESLETPNLQDQLERARSQISTQLAVLFNIANFLQNTLSLFVLIAAVAVYAPWLVLMQVATVAPLAIVEMHYAALLHQLHRERSPVRRMMEYLMNLSTAGSSVKEVRVFRLDRRFTAEYDRLGGNVCRENTEVSRKRNTSSGILITLGTGAYYGAYAYLISQAGHGLITIGTLFFLGGSFQRSKWQMQEILSTFSRTLDQAMSLGDVFEFFSAGTPIPKNTFGIRVPSSPRKGFEFRRVSFEYAEARQDALRDISFHIEPGETIALVGENGAGKTTLAKLLTRLYEPSEGSILLDGVDIREYDSESYQSAVSIVFQDFVRYEFTAGENIGFGDLDSREDLMRLDLAAAAGMASPLIKRLPNGYQQVVGKRFNGGVELSGGEWQRLATSRACMRNAQLLILDEPSASLDPKNEFLLIEHFAKLTANRMAVLISHRLPAVRIAHKILVLERGRLVEQGSHAELMAKAGIYASLFRLQASGYNEDFTFAGANGFIRPG